MTDVDEFCDAQDNLLPTSVFSRGCRDRAGWGGRAVAWGTFLFCCTRWGFVVFVVLCFGGFGRFECVLRKIPWLAVVDAFGDALRILQPPSALAKQCRGRARWDVFCLFCILYFVFGEIRFGLVWFGSV